MPATFRFLEFFHFFPIFPLKLVYFWTKSRKNRYGCFFHSFCATDLNFGTKNNGRIKQSTIKTLIFASYWGSPLVQFSKFKNMLWVCWFLGFIPPVWKLHNPYCRMHHHKCHWKTCKAPIKCTLSFVTLILKAKNTTTQSCRIT